jgi:hypothetical protein
MQVLRKKKDRQELNVINEINNSNKTYKHLDPMKTKMKISLKNEMLIKKQELGESYEYRVNGKFIRARAIHVEHVMKKIVKILQS